MNADLMKHTISNRNRIELPPAGQVIYSPDWLGQTAADDLEARLTDELDWQQRTIRLFGREVMQPRLVAFHGRAGVRYRYSGRTLEAQAWPDSLALLAERLSTELGSPFNSVLCNLYRDGQDAMGWHADDEAELGDDPVIASISLGAQRRFRLKPRDSGAVDCEPLLLEPQHGSLIVMAGDLQRHWLHCVPRTRQRVGPRINLTFRSIPD